MSDTILAALISAVVALVICNIEITVHRNRENRKRRYYNLYTPLIKMIRKYETPEFLIKEEHIQEFVDFMNDHIELLDKDLFSYRESFISYLEEQQYTIDYSKDYQAYDFIRCVEKNHHILWGLLKLDRL